MSNSSKFPINRRTLLGCATAGMAGSGLTNIDVSLKTTKDGGENYEYIQNVSRYIVATTNEVATEAAREVAEKVIRVTDREGDGKLVVGRFTNQAVDRLRSRNDIEYIEEDERVTPPDPIPQPQETQGAEAQSELRQRIPKGIDRLGLRSLHEDGITGAGADIAIIDSGIDSDHPDLQPNIGTGKAFIECQGNSCQTSWDDDFNHGTHVAGIAAAVDNSEGVLGVAPEATLHSAKIGSRRRGWYTSDVAAAIRWVADQGYSVANMSFHTFFSRILDEAIKYAYKNGVLLVAAAGNDGPCTDCVNTPADLPEVIAVSATTEDDQLASFSSTGPEVEFAAPGDGIRSTVIDGYFPFRGTSMASPHVAGAGALLMANGYTNVEAREQLETQAKDIGLAENEQGHGLVAVSDIDRGGTQGKITFTSEGGGTAVYEFAVSDSLSTTANSTEDTVNGTQAYGWVGPDRGVDTFDYEGEITALSLNGPAQITVDGEQVTDEDYPPLPDAITGDDFTPEPGTNTVTIESDGGGRAAYEFTVTESLSKTDSSREDEIEGTTAMGHVGPDRGTDAFEFHGEIDEFSLTGPATVFHNGEEVTSGEENWHTLTIESDGGGVAVYEFMASNSVEKTESSEEDSVDTTTAYGWVGPKRGVDKFRYMEELTGLELAGPATVFQDESQVDPANFPRLSSAITSENFDLRGSNKLSIESTGGGMAAYEFSVTESIQQVDDDDQVDRNTAFGHVGPDRGSDTFQITGNVTEFTLAGPATVSVNGEIVDADSVVKASGTTTTTIETTTTETATTTTDTPTTTTTTTATEEPTTTTTTTTDTPTTTTTEEEEDSEGEETTVGNGLIGWFLRI